MKYWFDTEFFDDGALINPISIGIVSEDQREYYAEVEDAHSIRRMLPPKHWVLANVVPHLIGPKRHRLDVREEIKTFVGQYPEFWAYCGAYDWVLLSQFYGPLTNRPQGWPFNHFDTNQLLDFRAYVVKPDRAHNALSDAKALKASWEQYKVAHPNYPWPESPETPK